MTGWTSSSTGSCPANVPAHSGGHPGPGFVPAWKRPTEGEARWQVAVAVAAAVALQFPLPGRRCCSTRTGCCRR